MANKAQEMEKSEMRPEPQPQPVNENQPYMGTWHTTVLERLADQRENSQGFPASLYTAPKLKSRLSFGQMPIAQLYENKFLKKNKTKLETKAPY